MIVAIGFDNIYGFQIYDGSITAEDYGDFIVNILRNHEEIRLNITKYFFYVDNCSTHHAKLIKEKLTSKVMFFYGPKYTPEFNSVENLFSIYKKRL